MSDVEVSSVVGADPAAVWDRVASVAGVNHELGPWLRMTAPEGVDGINLATVPLGRKWFRSRVLLFGVIPVDYDDLTLIELDPPESRRPSRSESSGCSSATATGA